MSADRAQHSGWNRVGRSWPSVQHALPSSVVRTDGWRRWLASFPSSPLIVSMPDRLLMHAMAADGGWTLVGGMRWRCGWLERGQFGQKRTESGTKKEQTPACIRAFNRFGVEESSDGASQSSTRLFFCLFFFLFCFAFFSFPFPFPDRSLSLCESVLHSCASH